MVTYSWNNIYFIGTSHISINSVNEVKSFIKNSKPDMVAIELDYSRYISITSNEKHKKSSFKDIRSIGFKGYLFSVIGQYIQKKLGDIVGVDPGSEMIVAIDLCRENKIPLLLIDQDIKITLKRLSKLMTWKERFRIFYDILSSPFRRKIEGIDIKNMDLTKVPDSKFIENMTLIMEKRYPSFYKSLIDERNHVMTKNLYRIIQDNPDKSILAVVGAGHINGIKKIIRGGYNKISKI